MHSFIWNVIDLPHLTLSSIHPCWSGLLHCHWKKSYHCSNVSKVTPKYRISLYHTWTDTKIKETYAWFWSILSIWLQRTVYESYTYPFIWCEFHFYGHWFSVNIDMSICLSNWDVFLLYCTEVPICCRVHFMVDHLSLNKTSRSLSDVRIYGERPSIYTLDIKAGQ